MGEAKYCKTKNAVVWRLSRISRGRSLLLNAHETALGKTKKKRLMKEYFQAAHNALHSSADPSLVSSTAFVRSVYQFTWTEKARKKYQFKGKKPKSDLASDFRVATMLTLSVAQEMLAIQNVSYGGHGASASALAKFLIREKDSNPDLRIGFRDRPLFLTRMDSVFSQVVALRDEEATMRALPPGRRNASCRMTELLGIPVVSSVDEFILVIFKYPIDVLMMSLKKRERDRIRAPTTIDGISGEAFKQGRVDKRLWKDGWGRTFDLGPFLVGGKPVDGAAELISPWLPASLIDRIEPFPSRNLRSILNPEVFVEPLIHCGSGERVAFPLHLLDLYRQVC